MSEQEMVDALNARKEPHYQRHDSKQPDPCGHWNCTYHGLCMLAEFRNICGSDEAVLEYISYSKPVSRESVCHCGHRCASVFWNNKHTTYMCQPGCDCVKNS